MIYDQNPHFPTFQLQIEGGCVSYSLQLSETDKLAFTITSYCDWPPEVREEQGILSYPAFSLIAQVCLLFVAFFICPF